MKSSRRERTTSVAKVLWTLCYTSPEEIPELQRPRRATGNLATRDPGSPCLSLGVGLAGYRFLCAGKYIALLIEHEWSGSQHPAHEGVTSLGILFMTWRVQGVMNCWLLVFLSRMCCHKAS